MTRIGRAARESQQAEAILEPLEKGVSPSAGTRAAASSSASGFPSSRRQISATVEALWGDSSNRRSAAAPARRTIRPPRNAPHPAWTMPRSGTGNGDKRYTVSPGTQEGLGCHSARTPCV